MMRRKYERRPRINNGRMIGMMGFLVAALVYVLTHLPQNTLPSRQVAPATIHGGEIVGTARIVDGDTVEIGRTRIRLYGIDAPEHMQFCKDAKGEEWACGQAAADALTTRIAGQPLSCVPRDTDRYGRTVAVCALKGVDLNAWMVAQGWAVAYRQYSDDYDAAEDKAKAGRLGIWAGTFERPSDWRRDHRG